MIKGSAVSAEGLRGRRERWRFADLSSFAATLASALVAASWLCVSTICRPTASKFNTGGFSATGAVTVG
jgi:hypothetical protein